jgi:hypothetical protein
MHREPSSLLSQKSSKRPRSSLGVAPSWSQPRNASSAAGMGFSVEVRAKLLVKAIILCFPAAMERVEKRATPFF